MDNNEKVLRELLWLNHGCPVNSLYGDDGEMQCNKCNIDFKRMPAIELRHIFVQRGINELRAIKTKENNNGKTTLKNA